MANSSFTGSVVGYASGTQPGLVSTVAQTFAGKKTLDGGAAIKGDTSGSAIAAGYVGEKITWASAPSNQTTTTTNADWTNASIILTPGIWSVIANISCYAETGATLGNSQNVYVLITDSSNTVVQNQSKQIYTKTTANALTGIQGSLSFSFVANLTVNTTYKIRFRCSATAGSTASAILNSNEQYSEFYGLRIG